MSITFNNTGNTYQAGGVNKTANVTVPAGTDALYVFIAVDNNNNTATTATPSVISWDGIPLTFVTKTATNDAAATGRVQHVYKLDNPTPKTATLSVTCPDYFFVCWTSVIATNPLTVTVGNVNYATSLTPSCVVSTSAGDTTLYHVVVDATDNNTGIIDNSGTLTKLIGDGVNGNRLGYHLSSRVATSTSNPASWTVPIAEQWSAVAINFSDSAYYVTSLDDNTTMGGTVTYATNGFTNITGITSNASGLTITAPTTPTGSATLSSWTENAVYPILPTTVQLTFTDGVNVAYDNINVNLPTGYFKTVLVDPAVQDNNSIAGLIYATTSGTFELLTDDIIFYTKYDDFVLSADSGYSVSSSGTIDVWIQIGQGANIGKMYPYSIQITGNSVDIVPNSFSFLPVINAAISTQQISSDITVSGVSAATNIPISITNGEYAVSTDGGVTWGAYTSAATFVQLNHKVRLRATSSSSYNTLTNASLTIGTISANFAITTIVSLDLTPDQFTFTAQTDVEAFTVITSNSITVTGIDSGQPIPISIVGGTYSINGGAYTALSGTVILGDTVTTRITSSNAYSSILSATLTIATISDTFTVTTRAADSVPTQFTFVDQTNVNPSTLIISNPITVVGIDTGTPTAISISSGEYSINGGAYTSVAGVVNLNDLVRVRVLSSGSFNVATSATLSIGTIIDTFSTTTRLPITTPTQFTFTDQSSAAISTIIVSNTINVLGIDIGITTPISITGGEYSINGAAYTSTTGSVSLNDSVSVRVGSSGSYATTSNVVVNIGGVTDTFTVTTTAVDLIPNPVEFLDFGTSLTRNTLVESNIVTVTGISSGSTIPITIVGGSYSINGGEYTTVAGTVGLNDTVRLQILTSPVNNTTTQLTVYIGIHNYTVSARTEIVRGISTVNNGDPILSGQQITLTLHGMSTTDVKALIFNINGIDSSAIPFGIVSDTVLSLIVPAITTNDVVSIKVVEYTTIRTIQLAVDQIISQLQVFDVNTRGFVPAPNTLTNKFLRDDGAWAIPDQQSTVDDLIITNGGSITGGAGTTIDLESASFDTVSTNNLTGMMYDIVNYGGSVTNLTYNANAKFLTVHRFVATGNATKTYTIQPHSVHAVPTGAYFNLRNVTAGLLTIVAGSGVTIRPPAGGTLTVAAGGSVTLICVFENEYDLIGQVVAS